MAKSELSLYMEEKKEVKKEKTKGRVITLSKSKEIRQGGSIIQNMMKTLAEIEIKIDDHLDHKKEQHDNK